MTYLKTFQVEITNGTETRTVAVEAWDEHSARIKAQRDNDGWTTVKKQRPIVPLPRPR